MAWQFVAIVAAALLPTALTAASVTTAIGQAFGARTVARTPALAFASVVKTTAAAFTATVALAFKTRFAWRAIAA